MYTASQITPKDQELRAYPKKRKCARRTCNHFLIAQSASDVYCCEECKRKGRREEYPQ